MKNFQNIIDLLDEKDLLTKENFSGPITNNTIELAEKRLGIKFSKSYKVFLNKLGCGGIGCEVYGITRDLDFLNSNIPECAIPNVVWTTLEYNKEFNHPLHLPIVYNVGEGTLYCLDTSQMNEEGECPVVAWPLGGYEETPVLEIVAPDFGTFFLDLVKRELEIQ
jgi:antitoxin YobK